MSEQIKQVLIYRRDLNMRKGKIAAQIAHASLKVFFDRKILYEPQATLREDSDAPKYLLVPLTMEMAHWVEHTFDKIVLSVETEADLLRCYEEAKSRGLPTALITDLGKTEFKTDCPTCDGGRKVSESIKKNPMRIGCLVCGDVGKVSVPTHTTVAIGPAKASEIDPITGPGGLVSTKLA